MPAKYIFVTGGVVSSQARDWPRLRSAAYLESRGAEGQHHEVLILLNVGPWTMSPFQTRRSLFTDDGAETDLDLGHYERFTLRSFLRITTGRPVASYEQNHPKGAPRRLSRQKPSRSSLTSPMKIKAAMKKVAQGCRRRHSLKVAVRWETSNRCLHGGHPQMRQSWVADHTTFCACHILVPLHCFAAQELKTSPRSTP